MEIAVVVPKEEYWHAFVRDMKELWVPDNSKYHEFVLGPIRYRMLNLSFDLDRYRGLRFEKIIIYNCHSIPKEFWRYFERPETEFVSIWN